MPTSRPAPSTRTSSPRPVPSAAPMPALLISLCVLHALLPGCGGGSSAPGVGITGVLQEAPPLDERDPETGEYRPYYGTGEMARPRYFHRAIYSRTGLVFAVAGSDERGLSGLDTVEFFDQSAIDRDEITPESRTGVWFDTNFEGDPIALEGGPRLFFTLSELADGRLLVTGGTPDIDAAQRAYEKAEIFDPETRSFTVVDDEMVVPRFRHSMVRLFDGSFLVAGGQTVSTVTIIDTNVEPGNPGRQIQRTVFETTNTLELYSPTENRFLPLERSFGSGEVTLSTPRGRAGHAMAPLAGFDQRLGTPDDVWLVAGGFQTLSRQAAPRTKLYGAVGREEADALTVIEFYDPQTRVLTLAGNVALNAPRIDTPHAVNLGKFNDLTIDGVTGMGNTLLVTHGNSDESCPGTVFNRNDEVIVATYTGFGPGQGIQLTFVEDLQTRSQVQGVEGPPGSDPSAFEVGRSQTNPVALPRALRTVPGVDDVATWVFAVGGTHIVPSCGYSSTGVIRSGAVFDPFFNLRAARNLGVSTRSLTSERTVNHPTGIVGTWLSLDGLLPTVDLADFGTTPISRYARMRASWRVYAHNLAIPGGDGIIDTVDDRLLLTGGGADGRFSGGEPASPSSELLVTPGAGETSS